jgi:WD40 repeat protein/energy-coupling factor transporter ATP-binding protein EcfA2
MMPGQADFNPFPGLRPYEATEYHLFFGREEQVDDLIRRLGQNHFLGVVGSSGSGKSSLVRAGLLPALVGGQLSSAGSDWRIAIMRPGSDPIGNLNHALETAFRTDDALSESGHASDADTEVALHLREALLRKSSLGLIDASHRMGLSETENLLVVVDQFEEIFRFARLRDPNASEDASAFVKLLLGCSRDPAKSIFIVLTMRSDFLGDCALFEDLPEILNQSQYLVPRMTRDQTRSAIAGPVAVGGAKMAPPLLQQILNEVGSNADQLPLMQHALMRTWEHWKARTGGAGLIETEDYTAVGSLAHALSDHAEEAYMGLAGERPQFLAEKIFKCLTEIGPDNRERRRPTTLIEISRVTGAAPGELVPVIDQFRSAGRSFLTPFAEMELADNTVIDISHESLIRNWTRLTRWCRQEADASEMYERLSDAARRYAAQTGGLWAEPELTLALTWRECNGPNRVWAERYDDNFDKTIAFLELSAEVRQKERREEEHQREAKRRAAHRITIISVAAAVLLLALAVYALFQTRKTRILSKQLSAASAALLSKQPGQEYEAMAAAIGGIPDDFPASQPPASVLNALIGSISAARFSLPLIHPLDIRGGVFSPDGKHVATVCEDGTRHLWDAVTGRHLGNWKGPLISTGHWPGGPVFSADSKLALFTGLENKVYLIDAVSGQVAHILDAGHETNFSGFVPAQPGQPVSVLTISTNGDAILWDVQTLKRIHEFRAETIAGESVNGDNHYAVFSSHPLSVLIWGRRGDARVLSLPEGETVADLPFQPEGFLDAEISSDGDRLIMLDGEGTARLYRISPAGEGRKVVTEKTIESCRAPRFAPVGDGFLCLEGSTIRLFGAGFKERIMPDHPVDTANEPDMISAAFSDDGRYIVSASHDETARVWDTASGHLLRTLTGHTDSVESAVFSSDGSKVLSVGLDNAARIWNWPGYSFVPSTVLRDNSVPETPVRSVAVSGDENTLYVGRESGDLELWDSTGGKITRELHLPPECHSGAVDSIAPLPNGSVVISSGNRVCLLTVGQSQPLRALPLPDSPLRRVVVSPDGTRLLTIQESVSKLFDAANGTVLASIDGAKILDGVFIPAANALHTISDQNWIEWDMRSGAQRSVHDRFPQGEEPRFARFSQQARYLVTNDPRHGLRLWTLNGTLKLFKKATGFWGPQTDFAFGPDETRLGGVRGHNAQLWPFAERDQEVVSLTFHTSDVLGLIFSPGAQGLVLTMGADHVAWLWGNEGTGIAPLRGHTGPVTSAAFFPRTNRVITGSEDTTARIFPSDVRRLGVHAACGICELLRERPEFSGIVECHRFTPDTCAAGN